MPNKVVARRYSPDAESIPTQRKGSFLQKAKSIFTGDRKMKGGSMERHERHERHSGMGHRRRRSTSDVFGDADAANDAGSMSGDQWIANAMTSKLYMLLTGEAPGSSKSNTFLSVVKGGMPFNEKSLSFLTDGQTDVESRERARRFAEIANTIPNSVGNWASSGGSLGAAYEFWLNTAMYPKIALETKYADALVQAKKIIAVNYKDYSKYRGEYQRAIAEYNAKKLINPNDPLLPVLRDAYKNALDAWEAIGSKAAVESAVAEKNKLERNGWASAFQDLKTAVQGAKDQSGYLPVEVVPEDFMTDPTVWSTYKFSTSETKDHQDSSSTSWGGGGSASYGLFSIGGNVSSSNTEVNVSSENTEMTVEFEYCRTQLVRKWFDTYVMLSQCWWYNGATKDKPTDGGPILSDGRNPPSGRLPMLATEAVWIRNLKVRFAKATSAVKQVEKSLKTSASVSYWLFSANANYENSSSSLDKTVKTTDTSVEFSGTCLGAFLCRVLEKTPNPLPEFLPVNRNDLQASSDVSGDADAPVERVTPRFPPPNKELNAAISKVQNDLGSWVKSGLSKAAEHVKKKATNYLQQQGPKVAAEFKKQATSYLNTKVASLKENIQGRLEKMAGLADISGASRSMYDNPHTCVEKPLSDSQLAESATIAAMENRHNLPKSNDHLSDLSEGKGEHHALSIAILTAKKWGPTRRILHCLFLDGHAEMQTRVAQVASTWTAYCGITFRFYRKSGSSPAEGINVVPVDVIPQIRISFQEQGNWSAVGTDCLTSAFYNKPTMNFGSLRNPGVSADLIRRAVLHEFGHAIGAIHEHQNPRAGIPWKTEVVMQYYRVSQGWTDTQIRHNIFDKYAIDQCNASAYDRFSIMHYPILAEHLTDPRMAVSLNTNLSELDKSFIRSVYGVGGSGGVSSDISSSDAPVSQPSDDAPNSFLTRAHHDIAGDVPSAASASTASSASSAASAASSDITALPASRRNEVMRQQRQRQGQNRQGGTMRRTNSQRSASGRDSPSQRPLRTLNRRRSISFDDDVGADADGAYNNDSDVYGSNDMDADADGDYNNDSPLGDADGEYNNDMDADADGDYNNDSSYGDADGDYNDADADGGYNDSDVFGQSDADGDYGSSSLRDGLP